MTPNYWTKSIKTVTPEEVVRAVKAGIESDMALFDLISDMKTGAISRAATVKLSGNGSDNTAYLAVHILFEDNTLTDVYIEELETENDMLLALVLQSDTVH